jgi:hypothetical protein
MQERTRLSVRRRKHHRKQRQELAASDYPVSTMTAGALQLQRTIGNHAVQSLFRETPVLARTLAHSAAASIQRDEALEQVKRIGPIDALRAKSAANTALEAAANSGLPGLHNGPADAFRHAYWVCLMTQAIGADQAKTVADTHEQFGANHANEQLMDDHNNAIGVQIGQGADGKDCVTLVMDALRAGQLMVIPNYKAVAASGGAVPPDPPVRSNTVRL